MHTLYTIGYQQCSLANFIGLLQQAGVDAVIDIRLRPTSDLDGYAKQADLAFLLREGFGIAYEHHPELAPTAEVLDDPHGDGSWPRYVTRFTALLAEREPEIVGRDILARYRAPCLLCYEARAEQCHRRLVAEMWAAQMPELTVVHL